MDGRVGCGDRVFQCFASLTGSPALAGYMTAFPFGTTRGRGILASSGR